MIVDDSTAVMSATTTASAADDLPINSHRATITKIAKKVVRWAPKCAIQTSTRSHIRCAAETYVSTAATATQARANHGALRRRLPVSQMASDVLCAARRDAGRRSPL